MKPAALDFGLGDLDLAALRAARANAPLDGDAALRLIAELAPLVETAIRRRPLLTGSPFVLPGLDDSRLP